MNKAVLFFKGILIGAGFLLLVIGVGGFLYTATHPEIADKLPGATMPAFGLLIFLSLVAFGFLVPSRKLVKALQIINAVLLIFVVILSIDGMFKDAAHLHDRATGDKGIRETESVYDRAKQAVFADVALTCKQRFVFERVKTAVPFQETWIVYCLYENVALAYDVTIEGDQYEVTFQVQY